MVLLTKPPVYIQTLQKVEIYLKQPPHASGLAQIYATKTLDYVYKGVGRVSKRWHGLRKNKKLVFNTRRDRNEHLATGA